MRYFALACDYDGTIATHGVVDEKTLSALRRFKSSGRKLILVTGRVLDELVIVFPELNVFDLVVCENGAVLYRPSTHEEVILNEPTPEVFVRMLEEKGVRPLEVGRSIVATWEPNETTILESIRDLGLELHVEFNKGSVMVLPPGVTKATGLKEALAELGLSKHNTVAVGDAENDHALLSYCECGVAVQNALPQLKERADYITEATHGAGVAELIDGIMTNDLAYVVGNGTGKVDRHRIHFGKKLDGSDVTLEPYGSVVLVAGPSGSGKSTINLGVLEHLMQAGYQFCLIDPEGDYSQLHGAVVLGTPKRAPSFDEVLQVLREPTESVVVNLLGIPLADRPGYFQGLLPYIQELRARHGRPHWIIVDETHHMLPSTWEHAPELLPEVVGNMLMITVHPDQVSSSVLSKVNVLVAVGKHPNDTMRSFAGSIDQSAPIALTESLDQGQVLVWLCKEGMEPFLMCPAYAHGELRRHLRKYAEGDVGPKYFMFRGEDGRLHLRAQNLIVFMQMAEGVDDDTWLYHLRRGDYSRWFEDAIKDKSLASAAAKVENDEETSAEESRMRIKKAIEDRFGTLP